MRSPPSSAQAGHAAEAASLTLFGTVWLGLWYTQTHAGGPLGWLVIAVEAALLLGFAGRKYGRHRLAPGDEAARAEGRRARRARLLVNVAQWVLIVAAIEVLARSGHAEWVAPVVIGLVGLRFFATAASLSRQPHFLTGGALLTLAAVYPVLAAGGPADPVGLFGAGVVLWASAALAIAN